MLNWLKRKVTQQDSPTSVVEAPAQDPMPPPDEPLVRDIPALLLAIDLGDEPEPDRNIDREKWQVWYHERERRFSIMVDRNLLARELERSDDVSTAVSLYEANTRDGFDGNFPYDRLAIIFRREGKLEDEMRVLERGIEVFSAYKGPRSDIQPKLAAFRTRLKRTRALLEKRSTDPA